jgi:PAS domain S-box-containing protein
MASAESDSTAQSLGAEDRPSGELERNSLLKAGALQDAIFNSAYFSSIATDEKGVIQIFNVGAERMLGYSAADVVDKVTPAEISDRQELVTRAATLSRELNTPIAPGFEALVFKASRGIEDIYELTYVRKDGSRFPAIVSVTALRDAKDSILGYLLIGTDNTARKEVEANQALLDQRLRDQQFYTRSLIESNVDALMTTDPQGVITDVNQQMIALTGRTRDELIGAPCKSFFTDPAQAELGIRRVLAEGKLSNFELTLLSPDGRQTAVSYNAATFRNRERKLQGVVAVARDVTERKRFEQALQAKNVELQHATRMKSEFLATMSHELRTPLNAIIGFSEALRDGFVGPLTDVQQEYTDDIATSGQHLLALINDILDLSKVEAGMMALELEPVDLSALLASSLVIVREKASAQRVSLEIDATPDLGVSQLDARKTKQIVYNLLSNAVKFSATGGRVALRARRVARNAVGLIPGPWPVHGFPIAGSEHTDFLELTVRDQGIGISPENVTRLFQAFSQIDSSLARKFEGTGLGLVMVKQLAELHGGTVAVASAEGEGSCFAVWLPLRTDAEAAEVIQPSVHSMRPGHGSTGRAALLVDADHQAADLIRQLLEAEGFVVLRAASTEAALRIAAREPLSLIALALELAETEGMEFLLELRNDPAVAHIPVLIIASDSKSKLTLMGGAATVLQKPLSRAQLKASLDHLGLQPSSERTRTVLVVDDDPKAVEVIATFLPTPAYAVIRAYAGSEALALAERLQPDLILLDLMMPEMSGFEVAEALQSNPVTARIPILVLTAKQVTQQDRAALNSHSAKPVRVLKKSGFNHADFITEVRRALSLQQR